MAGFAKMYAATRDPEFWDTARTVSDKWLSLLGAQEGPARGGWVPKWDFNAPYENEVRGQGAGAGVAVDEVDGDAVRGGGVGWGGSRSVGKAAGTASWGPKGAVCCRAHQAADHKAPCPGLVPVLFDGAMDS